MKFADELISSQVFLQYFVGNSNIFVIALHPDTIIFEHLPFTDSLLNKITFFQDFLSNPDELGSTQLGAQYTPSCPFPLPTHSSTYP